MEFYHQRIERLIEASEQLYNDLDSTRDKVSRDNQLNHHLTHLGYEIREMERVIKALIGIGAEENQRHYGEI